MKARHIRILRSLLWVLFLPLSFLWWLGANRRHRSSFKLSKANRDTGIRVLAVGSVFSGGSGKTPVVKALIDDSPFDDVVVLSRGFGRKGKDTCRVDLSDSRGCLYYGDEPWLLASQTSAKVWVGDRAKAISKIKKGFVLLDDGLQQRQVEPDFSLGVLAGAQSGEGAFCLPLGDLRAPLSSVSTWDAAVIISDGQPQEWRDWLHCYHPHVPVFEGQRAVAGLWDGNEVKPPHWDGPVGVFCGIARPGAFREMVARLGEIAFFEEFSDHYAYSVKDVEKLAAACEAQGAMTLLTTDKDWYKVAPLFAERDIRLLSLKLELKIPKELWETIEDKIRIS